MNSFISYERDFFKDNKERLLCEYPLNKTELLIVEQLYNSIFLDDLKIISINNRDIENILKLLECNIKFSYILDKLSMSIVKNIDVSKLNVNLCSKLFVYIKRLILKIKYIENTIEQQNYIDKDELEIFLSNEKSVECLFIYRGLSIIKNMHIVHRDPIEIQIDESLYSIKDELKEVYLRNGSTCIMCSIQETVNNTFMLFNNKHISIEVFLNRQSPRLIPLTPQRIYLNKELFVKDKIYINNISREGLSFILKDVKNLKVDEIIEISIDDFNVEGIVKYITSETTSYKVGVEFSDATLDNLKLRKYLIDEEDKIVQRIKIDNSEYYR